MGFSLQFPSTTWNRQKPLAGTDLSRSKKECEQTTTTHTQAPEWSSSEELQEQWDAYLVLPRDVLFSTVPAKPFGRFLCGVDSPFFLGFT